MGVGLRCFGLALLGLWGSLLASGCDALGLGKTGRAGEAGRDRPLGTVVIGRASDALGLDPARFTDNESIEVCEQIYEHLVKLRPGSVDVEPSLATAWTQSSDGRVWTFSLRPGVRFHDGTPFDAAAVKFSFDRQLREDHPFHRPDFHYWMNSFAQVIRAVDVVDPATVRISLYEPFAPLLASLAMFPVSIVSPAAAARSGPDFARAPVGTGPFRLKEWLPGDRVVLERNDDYWGPKPRLGRLVFKVIPDARQRLLALEGGTIDVAYGILPAELQFVALHPDLRLHRTSGNAVAYLAMNTSRPVLSDVRVRRAFNHAINKGPIVTLVYQGMGVPARGALPPGMWGYDDGLPEYAYDPARSRALLAEAAAAGAWSPGQVLSLYAPRTPRAYLPDPERVARAIQKNLEDVGVLTELMLQDLRPHVDAVERGDHDLCLFGWSADIPDPDNFLYLLLSRDNAQVGSARNVAFYTDAEVSGLLAWAQGTSDRSERERYYRRAQQKIAEDAPWVPLAHAQVAVAARDDVRGLVISTPAIVYYDAVWIGR